FEAEDGIRDATVTGVQTCALPILGARAAAGLWLSPADASPGAYLTGIRSRLRRWPAAPGAPPPTARPSRAAARGARRRCCRLSRSEERSCRERVEIPADTRARPRE